MKTALVYDRINKWGGAERLLLMLHELFPQAPLYTAVYNPKKALWAKVFDIRTSFLQKLPKASSSHEWLAALMPSAFESFSFDNYDLVISVTSESAKGIITKPNTFHLCYCLTPTRYLWSGYNDYFNDPIFRLASKPVVSYLRFWDKVAAQRPDEYISISKEVRARIKKYYNRDSEVVYPPNIFNDGQLLMDQSSGTGNYFLIVSRLVYYKRVDIAIKAFNKLGFPLKIIGTGLEEKKLKKLANKNIEFLGNLTDKELIRYYKNCIALVFPGIEDFGLSILEAQSFGKPVIAFREGGALEIIVNGKTGEFFYPQTEGALIEQLKRFNKMLYKKENCQNLAKKFNKDEFKNSFMGILEKLLKNKKTI